MKLLYGLRRLFRLYARQVPVLTGTGFLRCAKNQPGFDSVFRNFLICFLESFQDDES